MCIIDFTHFISVTPNCTCSISSWNTCYILGLTKILVFHPDGSGLGSTLTFGYTWDHLSLELQVPEHASSYCVMQSGRCGLGWNTKFGGVKFCPANLSTPPFTMYAAQSIAWLSNSCFNISEWRSTIMVRNGKVQARMMPHDFLRRRKYGV